MGSARCSTRPHAWNVTARAVPAGVAPGKGGIWAVSTQPGRLVFVDPRRDRVTRAFQLAGSPDAVAVGAGSVWVSDGGGSVARVNPMTGRTLVIRVGGSPTGIAFADGRLFTPLADGTVMILSQKLLRADAAAEN